MLKVRTLGIGAGVITLFIKKEQWQTVSVQGHFQALSCQQASSVACQMVLTLHLSPLMFFFIVVGFCLFVCFSPSDLLCQVHAFQSSIFCSSTSFLLFGLFPFPLMLIYSYIAVLHMESQRPSQLMSITSKYTSVPAVHGGGAVLPSILTGIVV